MSARAPCPRERFKASRPAPRHRTDVTNPRFRTAIAPGDRAQTASRLCNIGRSSSDLTKQEMIDLIELLFAFGAQHGVVFADEARAA